MYKNSLQNGKYILEQQLDKRYFDRTYKAINSLNGRSVVIEEFQLQLQGKIIGGSNGKDTIENLRKLIRCGHPNIARFNDFFIEDEIVYIVRELVIGESLDRIVLPNDPLEEAIAINYIRQIGATLKAIHSIGLLHENIKPQNIILPENNGELVLIGWFKRRRLINNKCYSTLARDGYIPIENYLPEAKPTPATDIYSLAATLYTLVTAQIPISVCSQISYPLISPKELRSDLSSEISIAIMQGMALKPEDRPQNIDEWLALLPGIHSIG